MDNIELKILVGMHRNVNSIDKNTSRIAAAHGLTFSQFAVLEVLYNKGDLPVGTIRKLILSSMGTIPLIIDNLVKRNYVRRLSDERDRRVSMISLTKEGRELIRQLVPENERMIREYMSVLTEDEKQNLFYYMKKIGGRINEEKSAE